MEDHLFNSLRLQDGAEVLGAGRWIWGWSCCHTSGTWAQSNFEAHGLESAVTVRRMDYHHLDMFADEPFDDLYTMETFFPVLRPGDHGDLDSASYDIRRSLEKIDRYAAMPANVHLLEGVLPGILEEAGFGHVVVQDL
ncbi:MAG: hypothetical protein M1818_000647 [Claussenomyces sp. TS43310]|nr:MAG: hypothetical protein M1818_000647 [Claussenomyces sp. TS43310]